MNIADVIAAKRPRTTTVWMLLDDALAAERDRLLKDLSLAERQDTWINRRPIAPGMRERLVELDQLIHDARVPFTFKAMGRSRWVELVEEFTDDKTGELDIEGFGPLMLSESSVDPETGGQWMTADDVKTLWKEWSAAETEELYIACFRLNREVRDIPFIGAVTDETANSDSNSITADPED